MKNTIKVFGLIALVAIIGFSFAVLSLTGCGGGGDDSIPIDPNNPFVGKWSDGSLTVTCTASNWSAVYPGQGSWSGPYTPNGSTANFTETNGSNFGTATISGTTMTVVSTWDTYSLTRK